MAYTSVEVSFRLEGNSIVVPITINGVETEAILDTGDAVGPVVTYADAIRCHVKRGKAIGVSGAGGATQAYSAKMDVVLGDVLLKHEQGAIDENLEGLSLLGLPFFLEKATALWFNFVDGVMKFHLKDTVQAERIS